jgi:hypothetical protein
MSQPKFWYIVKQENGTCQVVELENTPTNIPEESSEKSQWGSFKSEQEAIAKKIGLIRAGKCKPQ